MNQESILKKMTIVMPTYERLEFAIRNMNYWSGKQVQLLVLDGSKQKISDKELEKFSDNIKYYHLPISMAERLKFAKNLIFTEYVDGTNKILHKNFTTRKSRKSDNYISKKFNKISKIFIAEYNPYFGPDLEITVPYIKNFNRTNYHYSNLCYL